MDDSFGGQAVKIKRLPTAAVVTCCLFAAGAFGLALMEHYSSQRLKELFAGGTKTTGRCEELFPPARRTPPRFTYTFDKGEARHRLLSHAALEALKVGQTFDVYYDPLDPTVCVSEPERTTVEAGPSAVLFLILFGCIFLAIPLVVFLLTLKRS